LIREGIADYVAREGTSDYADFAEATGGLQGEVPLAVINRFGVNPKQRMLRAFFLEHMGWGFWQLLLSKMSLEDAEGFFALAEPTKRRALTAAASAP
jgi:hypothetical protein